MKTEPAPLRWALMTRPIRVRVWRLRIGERGEGDRGEGTNTRKVIRVLEGMWASGGCPRECLVGKREFSRTGLGLSAIGICGHWRSFVFGICMDGWKMMRFRPIPIPIPIPIPCGACFIYFGPIWFMLMARITFGWVHKTLTQMARLY